MKHILNDLTDQEKNAIREQHTGGMKVMTEKFSKLTNSKLGDVKLINEQIQDRMQRAPQSQPYNNNATERVARQQGAQYQQTNSIVPCSQVGVKTLGYCDTKLKKVVQYCASLGVKSPGICYVDTKQPVQGLKPVLPSGQDNVIKQY